MFRILFSAILFSSCPSNATVNLTSSAKGLCPGDAVVFTCVTNTGRLDWKFSTGFVLPQFPNQLGFPLKRDIFMLTLQNITGQTNNIYQSTAYAPYVPLNYSGESITCTDNVESVTIELTIEPPPSPPLNLTFTSFPTLSSVTISWVAPLDTPLCVHSYTVTVRNSCNSSQVMVYNTTDNRSSLSITDLTSDGEYLVTVAGRDGAGRLGEESEELRISFIEIPCCHNQTLLNLEEYHNIIVVGKDICGIFIKWKVKPELEANFLFIVTHNVSSDQSPITVNRTNVTLYGVQPGKRYSVEISLETQPVPLIVNFINYVLLSVYAAQIQPTNHTCEVLESNNLSVNRQGWGLSSGIITSIVSIVILVITSCGYLLVCVCTATSSLKRPNNSHHIPSAETTDCDLQSSTGNNGR